MAVPGELPPSPSTVLLLPIPWPWRSMPHAPVLPDPTDAHTRISSRQCKGSALGVEEGVMVARIAPGPTPLVPSVVAKATMTKSAETDLWVLSEVAAWLPVANG